MRAIPQWFLRELKSIDPRLGVEYNQHYNYFNVYINVDIYSYRNGRKRHRNERVLKACFPYLNDTAMTELRRRHWLAQRYNAKGDSNALIKMWKAEERDAKQKQKENAIKMLVEGHRKMYEVDRKKTYDMGSVA